MPSPRGRDGNCTSGARQRERQTDQDTNSPKASTRHALAVERAHDEHGGDRKTERCGGVELGKGHGAGMNRRRSGRSLNGGSVAGAALAIRVVMVALKTPRSRHGSIARRTQGTSDGSWRLSLGTDVCR